ncbi:MAG: isoprenylcysteine carboxylmethyltransferase family protein [Chromatiaceae bacterium]
MPATPKSAPRSLPEAPGRGGRGELLVVLQFVLFFAFLFLPAWNPWLSQELLSSTSIPGLGLLALCGLIALAMGFLGLFKLGRNLTPLPYPLDHNQLVTQGIYGWVRHPLYSSQLFAALGWVCYSLSLGHLLLLVVGFFFFDYKARKEESWLSQRHPEYADYAKRVSKLVPWVY